jgi:hypothetical protein
MESRTPGAKRCARMLCRARAANEKFQDRNLYEDQRHNRAVNQECSWSRWNYTLSSLCLFFAEVKWEWGRRP